MHAYLEDDILDIAASWPPAGDPQPVRPRVHSLLGDFNDDGRLSQLSFRLDGLQFCGMGDEAIVSIIDSSELNGVASL